MENDRPEVFLLVRSPVGYVSAITGNDLPGRCQECRKTRELGSHLLRPFVDSRRAPLGGMRKFPPACKRTKSGAGWF